MIPAPATPQHFRSRSAILEMALISCSVSKLPSCSRDSASPWPDPSFLFEDFFSDVCESGSSASGYEVEVESNNIEPRALHDEEAHLHRITIFSIFFSGSRTRRPASLLITDNPTSVMTSIVKSSKNNPAVLERHNMRRGSATSKKPY
jgi:hypothetical protein